MECQNTQNVKNTNSPYARKLIIGTIVAGAVVAGAYAINHFVFSGNLETTSPKSWDTTSTLKNGATFGAYLGGAIGFLFMASAIYKDKIGPDDTRCHVTSYVCYPLLLAAATAVGTYYGACGGAYGNVLLQGTYHISKEALGYLI
jgi:hypothetical protein